MINDDFSNSQKKLEGTIADIKKIMGDAIAKKETKLEEEYELHMNKMTCDIADNIEILTKER